MLARLRVRLTGDFVWLQARIANATGRAKQGTNRAKGRGKTQDRAEAAQGREGKIPTPKP